MFEIIVDSAANIPAEPMLSLMIAITAEKYAWWIH